MESLGHILNGVGSLGMLICFILMIVKMFQQGASGMAVLCLVLFFCCTIGLFIAFVYGWIKNASWGTKKLMTVWTVCLLLCIVGNVLAPSAVGLLRQFPVP
jgi:hypothetical protein